MRLLFRVALLAGLYAASEPATPARAQDGGDFAQQTYTALVQEASKAKNESHTDPWRFVAWPILVNDPHGVFLYATQGATNAGISPYQNNLAIGYETLNPTIHDSPRCNSSAGFAGFCGDEVAYGDNTLQFDVTGRDNTAIGDHALAQVTSAEGDTAVGSSAAANIHKSGGVDAFGLAACQNAEMAGFVWTGIGVR